MNGISIDKECLPKLPTGIRGLDKVLYGGIDVNVLKALHIGGKVITRTPLVIVIKGSEDDNDKSVLAMQMLYGIAQSVEKIKADYEHINSGWNQPVMYSTYYQTHKLDDMFLDYFISSSLQEILRKKPRKTQTLILAPIFLPICCLIVPISYAKVFLQMPIFHTLL